MSQVRKLVLREVAEDGLVTEWYVKPPPYTALIIVTEQEWSDMNTRRIYGWELADGVLT